VAALVVYWLTLFIATHAPRLPHFHVVTYADKIAHFVGYAGLSFLAAVVMLRRSRWSRRNALLLLGAVMAYGVLDELMQIPIPGRNADVADWISDCLGAMTGIILFRLVQKGVLAVSGVRRPVRHVALEQN
jgi:VanZ family protein